MLLTAAQGGPTWLGAVNVSGKQQISRRNYGDKCICHRNFPVDALTVMLAETPVSPLIISKTHS